MSPKKKAALKRDLHHFYEDAKEHIAEIELIESLLKTMDSNITSRDFVKTLVQDAYDDAQASIDHGEKIIEAYKKSMV